MDVAVRLPETDRVRNNGEKLAMHQVNVQFYVIENSLVETI